MNARKEGGVERGLTDAHRAASGRHSDQVATEILF